MGQIERATLSVYVPREDSDLRDEIWPGSAIVGSPVEDTGQLRLDFGGDDELYPSFRDRLQRAADRHTWERPDGTSGYPTQACAYVNPADVLKVGEYSPHDDNLELHAPAQLKQWVG